VPGSDAPLDILLKQIIGGWFILTDGQGLISKWGEPAEILFGRDASEALGNPFFEHLLAGPLSDDAEQWRSFLAAGDPPRARALVEVGARHAPTDTLFPLEAVFVPVKLDEGFDFSLFLEDLAFELPINLMLARMRQQHPVVVRAMRGALDSEPQPWDGWRTAGTMVAFRPLVPTPWVEAELVRRERDRAEQDAEREEAMTVVDPGPQGDVAELDDAAAVIARLLSAIERIDALERQGAARSVPELAAEQRRLDLEARLERLEKGRLETAADAELKHTAALSEATAAARAEVNKRLAQLEAVGGDAAATAHSTLESELERLRAEHHRDAEGRRAEQEAASERGDREREEAEAALGELSAALDRVERDHDRELERTRAELSAALERIDAVQREAERLSERVGAIAVDHHQDEALARDDRRRLEELQFEGEEARARLDALRALADELRADSVRGGEAAHALRDELAAARAQDGGELAATWAELEELRRQVAGLERGGDREQADLAPLLTRIASIEREEAATREQITQLASASAARVEPDELRHAIDQLGERGADVETLREQLGELRERVPERHDLEALRRELDELTERVPGREDLDILGRNVELLRGRTVAQADFDELRRAFDALREGGVGRTDLEGIRGQLATLADGWAAKGDLDALRDSLVALGESVPSRSELEALRAQLAETRHTAAGRDELESLRGQLDGLREHGAARADLDKLAERLDHVSDGLAPAAALERLRAELARVSSSTAQLGLLQDELAKLREESVQRADIEALRAHELTEAQQLDELRVTVETGLEAARGLAAAAFERTEIGSGHMLAEIKATGDRVADAAALARAAHGAAGAGRVDHDELRSGFARLEGELAVAREQLELAAGDALSAREQAATADEAAHAARDDAGRAREDAQELRRELSSGHEQLTSAATDVARLDRELKALREQLAGDMAQAGRAQAETLERAVERIAAQVAAGRAEGEAAAAEQSAELAAVRRLAERAGAGFDELRAEVRAVRTLAELANAVAEKARLAAEAQLDDEQAGTNPSEQAAQVLREMLGLATASAPETLYKPLEQVEETVRAPLPGFDEEPAPMAMIGIDGRFKQLNPSFCRLVGYQEHEFAKAAWPSPHDRQVYARQQEQLAEMVAGRLDRVAVESTFMHGQGLMVPIVGEITVVKGVDGRPSHLLLRAEARERAI
jgi:PAS domain S-box-containing protein